MKKVIEAVKAFFQIKKLFKKEDVMKIETIQKIWAIIGTLLATLNPTFLPLWVTDLFGPEGTQLVWSVFNAIVALWQFLPFRTGSKEKEELAMMSATGKEPMKLKVEKDTKAKALYALIPFVKAA